MQPNGVRITRDELVDRQSVDQLGAGHSFLLAIDEDDHEVLLSFLACPPFGGSQFAFRLAVRTGQCQIRGLVAASMLPCPDMLHVKSKRGSRCLGKPTVFAAIAGPVPNKLTHGRIHVTTLPDCGGLRAPEPAGL